MKMEATKNSLPVLCECGTRPSIVPIRGSFLGVKVVGCEKCRITGPGRMMSWDAVDAWNEGHRIGPDGIRICECCKEDES